MPFAYPNVLKMLPKSEKKLFHAWKRRADVSTETDEYGKRIGRVVCENLQSDGAIPPGCLFSLLASIAEREQSANGYSAAWVFNGACYKVTHQRQGQSTLAAGRSVWHLIPEPLLRSSIGKVASEDPRRPSDAWPRFFDAIERGDTRQVYNMLRTADVDPRGCQVFVTVDSGTGDPGYLECPDTWDATTACAMLGISQRWEGYQRGDNLWMLKYTLPVDELLHVPTCADAGWRSLFKPSNDRQALVGWTIPLGPAALRFGMRGVPEVVHRSLPFHESDARAARLAGAPRFLKQNAGW